MRNSYTCDICGKEIREHSWEDAPRPVHLCIETPSNNPLGPLAGNNQTATFRREDVCVACRREIAMALRDVLMSLTKEAPDA